MGARLLRRVGEVPRTLGFSLLVAELFRLGQSDRMACAGPAIGGNWGQIGYVRHDLTPHLPRARAAWNNADDRDRYGARRPG